MPQKLGLVGAVVGHFLEGDDERVVVSQFINGEGQLDVVRPAIRAGVPAIVFKSPFITASAAAEASHELVFLSRSRLDGSTSTKESVPRM